ncbi:MAG: ParB/RepB/Spo0J family partition protein [Thermoplasmataceae archaeon]
MNVNVRDIELRKSVYPRKQVSAIKVADYADAIESGSKFPPPVVCEIGGKFVIIDGAHRRAAYSILSAHSEEYGEIEVMNLGEMTEERAFEEAVRRNADHGMPFSADERISLIQKLQANGRELKYISGLLHMSAARIRNMSPGAATYSGTGKRAASGHFSVNVPAWLLEFKERVMKGTLDLKDDEVRSEIQKLRDLLDKILQTQEVEVE